METRLRVLHCYIHPVLMYGSEAWTIASDLRKCLESCELWFLRRMMRIPWTDKLTNEEVLQRAGVERKLIGEIRTRQMRFLRHMFRKDGLENLALTGMIEGKRDRGRKRMLWMTSLNAWIAERGIRHQEVELIKIARNRELWHAMIAHVSGYGT